MCSEAAGLTELLNVMHRVLYTFFTLLFCIIRSRLVSRNPQLVNHDCFLLPKHNHTCILEPNSVCNISVKKSTFHDLKRNFHRVHCALAKNLFFWLGGHMKFISQYPECTGCGDEVVCPFVVLSALNYAGVPKSARRSFRQCLGTPHGYSRP